jgi:hypothetical protein
MAGVGGVQTGSHYIRRLRVTDKHSLIFLGNEEYNAIYFSVLYSSVVSSVNRGI